MNNARTDVVSNARYAHTRPGADPSYPTRQTHSYLSNASIERENERQVLSSQQWLDQTARFILRFRTRPLARIGEIRKGSEAAQAQSVLNAIRSEHYQFRIDVAAVDVSYRSMRNNATATSGGGTKIHLEYTTVFNGVAITTSRWAAKQLGNLPYVDGIWEDRTVEALDDSSNTVIGAPAFWSSTGDHGENIDIGIIDSGIDYLHEELGGAPFPNNKVVGGYDFVNGDGDPMDDDGHGTHVAGIAAGDGPLITNQRGVAYKARLWAFKVLDASGVGYQSWVMAGIERGLDPDQNPATPSPIRVINLSLGGFGDPDDPLSQAIDNASNDGIVCVVAAGNSGEYGYETIGSPGCARHALTVGASTNQDSIAYFSSKGPSANLFTIKPDVVAPGVNITSAKLGGGYIVYSGTSMATPHVAGAAALIIQAHPNYSPEEVKAALCETAVDLGKDVWTQGSGRISITDASNRSVLVTPSSINFGIDDRNGENWSMTRTLELHNHGTRSQTFSMTSEFLQMPGVVLAFSPSSVTVAAGGTATVAATLTVDNSQLDYADVTQYNGTIRAKSTSSVLKINIPFGFVKARMMRVTADERPWWIGIHPHGVNLSFVIDYPIAAPGDTLNLVPPSFDPQVYPGFDPQAPTFELWGAYQDSKYKILKEDLVLNEVRIVSIHKAESKNRIIFKRFDKDGLIVPFTGISWDQVLLDTSGFRINPGDAMMGLSDILDTLLDTLYFPDVSPKYRFDTKFLIADHGGSYYEFPYTIEGGISSSVTLQNDPNAFKRIDFRFPSEWGTFNLKVHSFINPLYQYALEGIASRSTTTLFTGYFLPSPSPAFDFKYSQLFSVRGASDLFTIDSTKTVHTYTWHILTDWDSATVHVLSNYSYVQQLSSRAEPLVIKYGYGVPRFDAPLTLYNRDVSAREIVPYVQFWGPGGVVDGNITSKYCHNGSECTYDVKSNYTGNPYEFYMGDHSGIYLAELSFSQYRIGDDTCKATAKLQFNSDHPNLLYLESMRTVSNGSYADEFSYTDTNSIEFDVGSKLGIDSVEIDFQPLGGYQWEKGLLTRQGKHFSTDDLSLADGYTSIRIRITDSSSNSLLYTMEPAFLYHGTAPPVPTAVFPANDSSNLPLYLDLAWKRLPTAHRYRLEVALDSGFTNIAVDDSGLTRNSRRVGPLRKLTTYYWRVNASNVIGTSAFSNTWRYTTTSDTSILQFVSKNWNLISIPLAGTDGIRQHLYPSSTSSAFLYSGSTYVLHDSLWSGTGYWLRFNTSDTTVITGQSILADTFEVGPGWNLIGAISEVVPTGSIESDPPGLVTSQFFGYTGNYDHSDSIVPGKGYWVKVSEQGRLILSSSSMTESSISQTVARFQKRISIVPTAELPPPPPNEEYIQDPTVDRPMEFVLHYNYPNPFNPTTIIQYDLPTDSRVILRIYNLLGQTVQTLIDRIEQAGYKRVEWKASKFTSGLYFYKLDAVSVSDPRKTFTSVKKMLLIR